MYLDELEVYRLAMDLGEKVWDGVDKWDYFKKDTVGKQLVRAADSVAAYISEGFGRFHYKENINFCYYSRGSLHETQTWLQKSFNRKLVSESDFTEFQNDMKILNIKLNNYIKSIGKGK
jgi:four helix bundle protein